jgi:hypothetical protein
MTTKIVKINAAIAAEMLKSNIDNRAEAKAHVRFLKDQMIAGKWKFTADPIKISKTGRVLDGQHRLMAIIESNTEHDFLICYDLDNEIFDVLDTGKNRSAGNVLSIKGFENYVSVAALSKMIIRYNSGQYSGLLTGFGGVGGRKPVTNQDILAFAESNDLMPYLRFGSVLNDKCKLLTRTVYAFFYYLFTNIDEQSANIFFEKLVTGVGLTHKDPILYLRNKLIEDMGANNKMNARSKMGYVLKCWNLYRKNEECTFIRFNIKDQMPDPI